MKLKEEYCNLVVIIGSYKEYLAWHNEEGRNFAGNIIIADVSNVLIGLDKSNTSVLVIGTALKYELSHKLIQTAIWEGMTVDTWKIEETTVSRR